MTIQLIGRKVLRGARCVYCGVYADSLDHFPPLSQTGFQQGGWALPACSECNSFAGDRYPRLWLHRSDYVKAKIRRKYRKALITPDWSDDELDEVSPQLRGNVKAWQIQKDIVQERLAWSAANYLRYIVLNSAFVQAFVEDDIFHEIDLSLPSWDLSNAG